MIDERPLNTIVDQIKNVGELLIPYNYPKALPPPLGQEDIFSFLKRAFIIIDGYHIDVYYQKSDYENYFVETIQMYSQYSPFLPFNVVIKIAKKFLGSNNLFLVETYKEGRKLYIWTVYQDMDCNSIEIPYEVPLERCDYDGIKYSYLKNSQVLFI